ncbi:MAG: aldehyde dehydrogenase family protein [Myxococcota bacterium]|jgi:succinylglutamic semialdehyde dehydrogenase|nr:aldehyde dehydrogenase family protein [Myxococcota bacterium]
MTDMLISTSPAEPGRELGRFAISDTGAVEAAVDRARRAFRDWRNTDFEKRATLIRRFGALAQQRVDELARLIAMESGKALWDATAEAKLIAAKVDVSLGPGMELVAEQDVGGGARATHHPRGVLAVYGPFNFPAHLPNGHIVPALATGNTVVFKPSEHTPATGAYLARLWEEAGLPAGVFEVVQGGSETGRALAASDVDGILFTGSYAVGRALEEAVLDAPNKILALEMGGRNAIAVQSDANFDLAVAETALSICVSTGQRCTCASRVFVASDIIDEFCDRLVDTLKRVRIGHPLEADVFMGPLINGEAAERVERFRSLASAAGGERILRIDPGLAAPYVGPGLVRFDNLSQTHPYQREEIFGPEAAIYPAADIDEAIAAINDSDYGLAAALFTGDPRDYDRYKGRVRTGILNWNKGTTGASGKLPFGGLGKSGNDRPAGIAASLYTTFPQAHLEGDGAFDPNTLPPGFPRREDD